eukprot:351144-Chlamydomonas_euryale.AAC.3
MDNTVPASTSDSMSRHTCVHVKRGEGRGVLPGERERMRLESQRSGDSNGDFQRRKLGPGAQRWTQR